MKKIVSISQARGRFARIVRDVERGATVTLTRRGEEVAVLISTGTYHRLRRRKQAVDWGAIGIDTREFRFDREEANAR